MVFTRIDDEYRNTIADFLNRHDLHPRDPDIVIQAFVHRSFAYESGDLRYHNERLEFLGDAVVELVVSDYLYRNKPDLEEGELTKLRSAVVNAERLASSARSLGCERLLLLAFGAEKSDDRHRDSVLSDLYEALVGALYLTCPFPEVSRFVIATLRPDNVSWSDPKSELQEYCQANFRQVPQYRVIDSFGPQHKKNFVVEVDINGRVYGPAQGLTKKEAEQQTARLALHQLTAVEKTVAGRKNKKRKSPPPRVASPRAVPRSGNG